MFFYQLLIQHRGFNFWAVVWYKISVQFVFQFPFWQPDHETFFSVIFPVSLFIFCLQFWPQPVQNIFCISTQKSLSLESSEWADVSPLHLAEFALSSLTLSVAFAVFTDSAPWYIIIVMIDWAFQKKINYLSCQWLRWLDPCVVQYTQPRMKKLSWRLVLTRTIHDSMNIYSWHLHAWTFVVNVCKCGH